MVGTLSSFEMAPRRGRVSNFGGLAAAGDPGVVPTDSNTCECVSHFCGVLRSRPASAASCVLKKTAFQLFLQRVVGMWVDFFVLAPNQNSGWALVNSSIGLSVSAGNACAHFFANRRTRSIPRRPSSVRVTGQTSQMRVSETGRKRARVKAAVASAAVVNNTMIRAAHAAESPKAQGSPRSACSKAALLQLLVWKRLLRTSLRSLLCS
jgi:hypothetical protein